MKKVLAKYLGNILWMYLYMDSSQIKNVEPEWIDGVVKEIEKTEDQLVALGVTEKQFAWLFRFCARIVEVSTTNPEKLPPGYMDKIAKVIFSTPVVAKHQ